jgi:hypothetical protein
MSSRPVVEWVVVSAMLVGMGSGKAAWAAGPNPMMADATVLVQMEDRANNANPREKCYLYAEVLAGLTELESQQIAANELEKARATMQHMDEVAAKIHAASVSDAKKLKNAEQVLERTTRRVQDMARVVGAEEQTALQSTLQHMNTVHNELLAMVFAH